MHVLCSFLIGLGVLAARANASVFFSFDATGVKDTHTDITLAPNASVDIPMYLEFTGADVALLTSELGLFSSDVHLVWDGALPAQPVGISSPMQITANPAFDEPAGPLITYTSPGDVDLFQSIKPTAAGGVAGTAP